MLGAAAAAACVWWLLRAPESGGTASEVVGGTPAPMHEPSIPPETAAPAPNAAASAPRARVQVSGRVVDGSGAAVRDAELLLEGLNHAAAATTSDSEGRFTAYLPLLSLYSATATAEGFVEARFDDLPPGEDVLLHLRRDVVLAGVAVYAGGGAVARYTLDLRPVSVEPTEVSRPAAEPPGSAERRAPPVPGVTRTRQLEVSDAEGRFELHQLSVGTYRLMAHAADGASGEQGINLGADGLRGVTLELVRGGTVRGLVLDAETGAALPRAEVVLRQDGASPGARSGEDGRFEINAVPAGRYHLAANARGYRELQRWDLPVEAGTVLELEDLELAPQEGRRQGAQVRFGGIGARLGGKRGWVTIAGVEPGGPAEREGLVAGDRVMAIDGQAAQHLSPGDVARQIRGSAGRAVSLEVERDGRRMSFVLVREAIEMDLPPRRKRKR